MADEEKKVSFGFSKTIKKSALQVQPKQEKKVDYIECLDEKAIRVAGGEDKKDEELVIPMLGSKTWCDRILNKTDADIFEPKTKDKEKENGETSQKTNGDVSTNGTEPMDVSRIKKEVPDETVDAPRTLEEQAAREIVEDLKSKEIKVEKSDLAVPIAEDESLRGKQESTLEDYEQIPIDGFGLAVLRGMGWKPGKGIGKNEKLVAATLPELRPRGMGLGADKLTLQKLNNQPKSKEEEQLKIEKGSFVRVIIGKHNNNYGQIEGFDDGAGRLIVKMALSGETLSLNENVVEPVTKSDFAKNSKVLNATKFEEYKNKTQGNGKDSASVVTSDSETSEDRETGKKRRAEKSSKYSSSRKKSKKRSKYSSDEDSDSDHRSKRLKSSSESDYEYRQKKSKKSKKSHRRDSSSERSSNKNRRKDKQREKTRERRPEHSESSTDRRQHKKHKRSRSRSPRRR